MDHISLEINRFSTLSPHYQFIYKNSATQSQNESFNSKFILSQKVTDTVGAEFAIIYNVIVDHQVPINTGSPMMFTMKSYEEYCI